MEKNNNKFQVVAGSTPFIKPKESCDGKVYKECTTKEKEFYEKLSPNNELWKFIPKYFGTITQDGKEYIVLEDLTFGYKIPNIMDIKLGLSHHDVDLDVIYSPPSPKTQSATAASINECSTSNNNNICNGFINSNSNGSSSNGCENQNINFKKLKQQSNMSLHKQLYESWLLSKYLTTPKLGFCVCGSIKHNCNTNQIEKIQKEQGRTFTPTSVKDKLFEFFHNGIKFRSEVVDSMIERLSLFKQYFENNPDYRFRSTSILFLYEGDSEFNNRFDIRLIDFTHAKLYPSHMKPHSSKLSHYKSIDINNELNTNTNNTNNNNNTTSTFTNNNSNNNNNNNESTSNDDNAETFFPIDGGYLFGVTNLLKILLFLKNKQQHPQQ